MQNLRTDGFFLADKKTITGCHNVYYIIIINKTSK